MTVNRKRVRIILAVALASLLALSGCAGGDTPPADAEAMSVSQPPVGQPEVSQMMESNPDLDSSPAEEALFYPADEWRWSEDGRHLLILQDSTIRAINLDNQVEWETSFPHADYIFSFSDDMVFLSRWRTAPSEETRVISKDGRLTFTNALIYDINGNLIREFPSPEEPLNEEDLEPFEKSIRQAVSQVFWLDGDHLTASVHTKVYLYTVSTDTLELVDDLTDAVRGGYSVMNSSGYGAFGIGSWGGAFYYTASRTVYDDQMPRYEFCEVRPGQPVRTILDAASDSGRSILLENGTALVLTYEETPEDYDITISLGELPDPEFQVVSAYRSDDVVPTWDGRTLIYNTTDYSGPSPIRTFHILDTWTGKTHSFVPQDLDNRERNDGIYAYSVLFAMPGEEGFRCLHALGDTVEITEDGETFLRSETSYYLYDSVTRENRLLPVSDIFWTNWDCRALNPDGIHLVEGHEQVRVISLNEV